MVRFPGWTLLAFCLSLVTAQAQAPAPRMPPRDPVAPAARAASGVIRGRVVDGATGRGLRRVRITLTAPGIEAISASTDDDGSYALTGVPAGRVTLAAQRSGYLRLRYGQIRPNEQGRPLDVADGQMLERVDFALPPIAVIAGRITDELGEPIAGVWVSAQRLIYRDNRRRLMPDGPIATTDDDGEYRIAGLAPGTYVVNARTLEKWTVNESGREDMMGYAPTFFPGVADAAQASRLTVTTGQSVPGIDFALVAGRAATVSGIAIDSRGQPIRNVMLGHDLLGTDGGIVSSAGGSPVDADGRFTIRGVPPGEYRLQGVGTQEQAAQPIVVDGVDVTNVSLTTSAGWSVRGAFTFDGDPAGLRRNQVTISAVPLMQRPGMSMAGGIVPRQVVNDDWSFLVSGVVGGARLRISAPEGWAIASVRDGSRDIGDLPLDLAGGEELSGVQITLTNRVATLAGEVVDPKGAAGRDGTVLLFPTDTAKWYEGSRFIRAVRPDQRGQYRIPGVITGEYWAIALDYVEDGIWNDPEYLESVRRLAQRVVLREPALVTLPLKVVTP